MTGNQIYSPQLEPAIPIVVYFRSGTPLRRDSLYLSE